MHIPPMNTEQGQIHDYPSRVRVGSTLRSHGPKSKNRSSQYSRMCIYVAEAQGKSFISIRDLKPSAASIFMIKMKLNTNLFTFS